MTRDELKAAAVAMLGRAYVPYSHFPVGAALECGDGTVFSMVQDMGVLDLEPGTEYAGGDLFEAVLEAVPTQTVLMGNFSTDIVDSKVFQSLTSFLEETGQPVTAPQPGEVYSLGENAFFTILIQDDSEQTAREGLNDCSMGLILEDGLHRFLFYGDGEEKAEEALQNSGYDLACDVLMVAHHGGKSSTKKELLEAVRPRIAVISCGLDEDGQLQEPSDKVLRRLDEAGVAVYRTDRDHTVVIISGEDGLEYVPASRHS